MAEIFRARSRGIEGFEKILCVKRILPVYASNRAFIKMLVAEAKLSSLLHHGNVVQILDLGEVGGQFYIVMEYVHGGDLLELLTACTKTKQRLPTELALYIISEAAKGLAYAHGATNRRGQPLHIIHRDVSPSNILISYQGDVKVVDFGVARADLESQDSSKGSKGSALKGKLGYMSPELVTGGQIDHRSDIFALGIVLWEALTLRRLFLGKTDIQTLINIRDVNIDKKFAKHSYVPAGVQAIIRKALAKHPDDRYQTATDLQEAILDYLFDERIRVTSRHLAEFLRATLPEKVGPPPELCIPPYPAPDTAPPAPAAEPAPTAAPPSEPVKPPADAPSAPASEPAALPIAPDHAPDHAPDAGEDFDADFEDADDPTPVDDDAADRIASIHQTLAAQSPAPNSAAPPSAPAAAPPAPAAAAVAPSGPIDWTHAAIRVRTAENSVFGPIGHQNLLNLVRTGGVTATESISVNGGPWLAIDQADIPDMDTEALQEEAEQPLYEGPVTQLRTPQLLYELAVSRVVGKLKMSHRAVVKEVYFQAGKPVHITSNIKTELLANFMAERGLIGPTQLQAALNHASAHNSRVGDSLVAMGILKPHDLFRAVELQFRQRFLQLMSWRSGWYEFLEGYPPPAGAIPTSDSTVQLVSAGIRTHFDLRTVRHIFAPYLDHVLLTERNPHITHNNLRFNSKELRFYTHLETGMTLREALSRFTRTDQDELIMLRVIFTLHQMDLLSLRSPSRRTQV